MDIEAIKEAWQILTNEDTPPKEFLSLVSTYRKRKSVFTPQPLDLGDFAALTLIYDLMLGIAKKDSKAKDDKPKETRHG